MTQIVIRKSGGANIVSLPKAVLESLGLQIGSSLDLSIVNDEIRLTPAKPAIPTLDSLLEGSPAEKLVITDEDRGWINGAMGNELI